jgi:hypothetical protein
MSSDVLKTLFPGFDSITELDDFIEELLANEHTFKSVTIASVAEPFDVLCEYPDCEQWAHTYVHLTSKTKDHRYLCEGHFKKLGPLKPGTHTECFADSKLVFSVFKAKFLKRKEKRQILQVSALFPGES